MYCGVMWIIMMFGLLFWWHPFTVEQRFLNPVLEYHSSAHFVCFSYRFRHLYYSTVSALRSGHWYSTMIPAWNECICSIKRLLKCTRREFKLYLFTEVCYVPLHVSLVSFVCVWRCCRLWLSANPWMNVPKWRKFNGFPVLREKGAMDTMYIWDHVNRNTVHARSSLLTSWWSESGMLTKRHMQNMQSGGTWVDWNWEPLL